MLRASCVDTSIGTSSKFGADSIILRNNDIRSFNHASGRAQLVTSSGVNTLIIENNKINLQSLYKNIDVTNVYNLIVKGNIITLNGYNDIDKVDSTCRSPGLSAILVDKRVISDVESLLFVAGKNIDFDGNIIRSYPVSDDNSLGYALLITRGGMGIVNINNNTIHGCSNLIYNKTTTAAGGRCDKLNINNNNFLWNKGAVNTSGIIFNHLFSKKTYITGNKFENPMAMYPNNLLIGDGTNEYIDTTTAYTKCYINNNIAENPMKLVPNGNESLIHVGTNIDMSA
jgi:hypothetical protein